MPDRETQPPAPPPATSPDKPRREFRGPTGLGSPATAVAWSPDGQLLAAAFGDWSVRLWQVDSGDLVHVLEGHASSVNALAWSPDGQRLASASRDGAVRVWDTSSGALLRTHEQGIIRLLTVAWSPDGEWLAAAGGNVSGHPPTYGPPYPIFLWDAATGALVRQIIQASGVVLSVAWSPDSQRLAAGCVDSLLYIWDAASGALLRTLEGQRSSVNAVAWAPNGRWLATAGGDALGGGPWEDPICLWDATTGALLRRLPGHNAAAHAVAWASDGRRLASAGGDLYALDVHGPEAATHAEDPDFSIRLWEAATGRLLDVIQWHGEEVWGLAWSPDGQRLASASFDGRVPIWWVGGG